MDSCKFYVQNNVNTSTHRKIYLSAAVVSVTKKKRNQKGTVITVQKSGGTVVSKKTQIKKSVQ
jgi:hypothetical protein